MILTSLDRACRYVAEKGLVIASSGNMSQRAQNDLMRITKSGDWFEDITDTTICSFDKRTADASSEWLMHALIYQARPYVSVILHCQSPYATALSCMQEPVEFLRKRCNIPELSYYIKKYDEVGTFKPGSDWLAKETARVLKDPDCNVAILKDHGQVVVGNSFNDVIQKALFFELSCKIACIRR